MAGNNPKYRNAKADFQSTLSRFLADRVDALRWPGHGRKGGYCPVAAGYRRRKSIDLFSRANILVLLLAVVLVAGGWFIYQTLNRSDIFRLREISVQGNRMTQKDQILTRGNIEQGISLLSFDSTAAEQRISQHPWIDHVKIERIWPFTMKVRVYEHRPLALINIERNGVGELYYVDHKGEIFARVDQSQDVDFPVITGVSLSGELLNSSITDKNLAGDAFEFLRIAARGNPIIPLQTVSEVHVSQGKGIIVYLVEHPFPIYMGYDSIDTRYYQLVKLLERLYRKKKVENIKEIRMDYQADRILVARLES